MATLSAIHLYPIKSCAGIALRCATLTRHGVMSGAVRDREWMVVDANGQFLTQREHPRMALIVPRLQAGTLSVSAPGQLDLALELARPDPAQAKRLMVQVWDDRLAALDCGAAAALWFSQALGLPCRLVRSDPAAPRLASAQWTLDVAAPTLFADGFPLLVIGSAALADLNHRLVAAGRAALPMDRFRPNLVFDGIDAFEEDYAASFELGATRIKPVKPCSRCQIPATDQATGLLGPDPLDILQSYRAKPELDGAICFGMNCIVQEGGAEFLQLGQEVGVTLGF